MQTSLMSCLFIQGSTDINYIYMCLRVGLILLLSISLKVDDNLLGLQLLLLTMIRDSLTLSARVTVSAA